MRAMERVVPHAYRPAADALRDRVILVTGAGDGIGRAVAIECARVGATMVLLGRTLRKLEATYDAIEKAGGPRPAILTFDLGASTVMEFVGISESLHAEYGRLDGLAHVAGVLGARTPLDHYDAKVWTQVLAVNLTAPFLLTQALLPLLRKGRDPAVVFTSSGVGRKARAFWGAYAVSKFGLEGLMQVFADECDAGSTPVRMNSLNPGPVRTAMRLEAYPAEDRDQLRTPEMLAPAFVYLLGNDSAGVTGAAFDAPPA
jgi:NAD(P)-dependent dehydrogenase (short-subunit alcohol dehydrogenase family)